MDLGDSATSCRSARLLVDVEDEEVDCDSGLLSRADSAAFVAFYRRNYDVVCLWLERRLGDRADVEELASSVFLAAMLGRDRFDPERGTARAWLWGLTRIELLRWRRARARGAAVTERNGDSVRAGELHVDEELVDRRIDEAPILRRIDVALRALPPNQRTALELRMAEHSYAQIARLLGCSPGAARVRVHRGLAALRRAVGPEEGAPRGSAACGSGSRP